MPGFTALAFGSCSCKPDRNTAFSLMSADKNIARDGSSSWAARFHASPESLGRLGENTGSGRQTWVPSTEQLRVQFNPGKAAR